MICSAAIAESCAFLARQFPSASGEDDLRAAGEFVEFSDREDLVDLWTEIVPRQLEHVDGRFTGVNLAAGIVNHLEKLADRRDVDLVHFFFHHCGRYPLHSG